MMRIMLLSISLMVADIAGALEAANTTAITASATDLLKESDRARGAIDDGITWNVEVQEFTTDGSTNKVSYIVKALANDALAEAIAPPRNKGELLLFNDRNLWFFKPGLKKPVSISARQKLMGQAANGDIASTQYRRDYDGQIVGEEKINNQDTWKLELKAKAKNVTYDRIRYWISKDQRLGVKAEFLTVGGDIFKFATFEYNNTYQADGKNYAFISKMTIVDALNQNNKTIISYDKPQAAKHAASLFNVNNLIR